MTKACEITNLKKFVIEQ